MSNVLSHIMVLLVFSVAVGTAALQASQQHQQRSPKTMELLARAIHARVRLLVVEYNRLTPTGCDPETAFLSIYMVDNVAVIDRIGSSGCELPHGSAVRSYRIYPDGSVQWHILGYCRPDDYAWCEQPLTVARLEYLLAALQEVEMYSPSRVESRAS